MQKGDEIARIYPDKESYDNALSEYVPVNATITGIIRGLIPVSYTHLLITSDQCDPKLFLGVEEMT